MPNWKTHLEISKKINEDIGFAGEDLELFLIGSVIPDLNNGYLVKNISKNINHKITHFCKEDIYSYKHFLDKYKNDLKNPFVYGFFIHLYTDFFWNNNYYERLEREKETCKEHDVLRIRKQSDFRIYNNKFIDNKITLNYIDKIVEQSKIISEIHVTKEDLLEIKNFIEKQEEYKREYEYYTEEELDVIFNNTIKGIKDFNTQHGIGENI